VVVNINSKTLKSRSTIFDEVQNVFGADPTLPFINDFKFFCFVTHGNYYEFEELMKIDEDLRNQKPA
jgi:DNA polymerase III sliding clamp (beta) subunit (PCNA family)